MNRLTVVASCLLVTATLAGAAPAQSARSRTSTAPASVQGVEMASLFTHNMVLQQGMRVPVWGTAPAGTVIAVIFAGQERASVADTNGHWRADLDALAASSEPRTLNVTSVGSTNRIALTNVVVGEVWIGSGQSNMEFPLRKSANATEAIAAANDPLLRLFTVEKTTSDTPLAGVKGTWSPCDPVTVAPFSAVAYYFGQELRRSRGIPVGLICSAWGGTCAEAWTPADVLQTTPQLAAVAERYQKQLREWDAAKAETLYQQQLTNHTRAAAEAEKAGRPKPKAPTRPQSPALSHQRPSGIYNAMIAPLQPFAIKGVIWYQGEANRDRPGEYTDLLSNLIRGWRHAWQNDFPFLFVQIAPYKTMPPALREAQLKAWQQTPGTAMIVITDHGNATNIHPTAKEPVGKRLALAARALAYGETVEASGPVYTSVAIHGGQAVVSFTHVGKGLMAKDGPLKGFVVAGPDNIFKPAEATIQGETVVVRTPDIPDPKAVRYGWDTVPEVNLFNQDGLPASPFRTDDWAQ